VHRSRGRRQSIYLHIFLVQYVRMCHAKVGYIIALRVAIIGLNHYEK